MRATVNELMDKLGIGYVPGPYESVPVSHHDPDKGATYSAEVRMGMDSDEVEAEIQLLYDQPVDGKSMEQICYLQAKPANEGQWTTVDFRFRNAPFGKEIFDWEEKACTFFQGAFQDIGSGNVPNFDELLDDAFHKRERFTGTRGGGGGKSPKIKPGALMNVKRGGF
jgi:hypothetical protein